jgi:1,2-diacylglycerol 3-alpha-glucosyltransferase
LDFFSDTYLPINNGISYVVELTRSGLEALGHEVYIFAPSPDSDYVEDDGHIIRYRAIKGATYEDDLTSVFFPPLQLQKINKLKLDIIHFFTPNQVGLLGLMAGLKYDVPVIAQYSTDIYQYVDYYPAAEKVILAFPIAAPIVLKGRLKSWGRAFREIPKIAE